MNIQNQIIDNREISILIWLGVFLIWSISKKEIRKSFISLIKWFFQKSIITLTLILVIYVSVFIYFFYYFNYWDFTNLSDTVIWFFGVAFVMLVNINHAGEDGYFKKIIIENIKFVVFIEFVINLYVLDLWAELIFVPVLAVIGALWGYSSAFPKYKNAEKFLSCFISILGLGFLVFATYNIIVDFQGFVSTSNLKEYLLPIVFTILIFPVIYFMALYVSYGLLFVRINFIVKNPSLAKFTKWRTVFSFQLNLKSLKKWSTKIHTFNFERKDDVIDAIRNVKKKNA